MKIHKTTNYQYQNAISENNKCPEVRQDTDL